ncbi:hypothetical protein [Xanthobacter oligotrophicus]|uniref:hypothetical protein n=1 Tax=Xanthobacter oligotrophicus TaxID=2607286 RepID=UPI0011F372E9|nr:hypothetical protein [Xanthobacter oligotrophicus]MCG5236016.1 hypothetical protein [Xanthobacter oligotrophicus]
MKQLLNLFGGVAGLVVAGLVGLALFTLVGGLIVVAGIVITTLVLGGGVYALVTGRAPGMRRGGFSSPFGSVRVFDLRSGQPFGNAERAPDENGMIDVTPPKPSASSARTQRDGA